MSDEEAAHHQYTADAIDFRSAIFRYDYYKRQTWYTQHAYNVLHRTFSFKEKC